ncbi:MAG: CarD family transcriptional regulator, partial [Anaerovoracaceae bacterium]
MYKTGDKIVYPMHGAGIIEKIEERTILGKCRSYFVIKASYGHMSLMVPIDKCEAVGIRNVISKGEIDKVVIFL